MSKPKSVEELYVEAAIVEFVKKAQEGVVSDYIKNAYMMCKSQLGNMTLQEFAAFVANYNPNKSGIGERSQINWLRTNKFPSLEKLSNRGKEALSLFRQSNGKLDVVKGKKSNLNGVKSFDAYELTQKVVNLFLLKTVDIGPLSDSVGGGHQTNVQDEVVNFINHIRQQKLSFAGKDVKVYIVIDGRSADTIIKAAQAAANGDPNIVINESALV